MREARPAIRANSYFAIIKRAGQETKSVLPDLLRRGNAGAALAQIDALSGRRGSAGCGRWSSVMALFDGKVLPLALDSVPVGDKTLGHRFLVGRCHRG